jgi:Sulfotransferase domain
MRIINTKRPALNYKELVKRLLSSEEEAKDTPATFFDETPFRNKIAYSTYPRSGSTQFRKYFEDLVGVSSGSCYSPTWIGDLQLQYQGFMGEGYLDNKVWLVKTHEPCEPDLQKGLSAPKTVVCIRSPVDALTSLFNMKGALS